MSYNTLKKISKWKTFWWFVLLLLKSTPGVTPDKTICCLLFAVLVKICNWNIWASRAELCHWQTCNASWAPGHSFQNLLKSKVMLFCHVSPPSKECKRRRRPTLYGDPRVTNKESKFHCVLDKQPINHPKKHWVNIRKCGFLTDTSQNTCHMHHLWLIPR